VPEDDKLTSILRWGDGGTCSSSCGGGARLRASTVLLLLVVVVVLLLLRLRLVVVSSRQHGAKGPSATGERPRGQTGYGRGKA